MGLCKTAMKMRHLVQDLVDAYVTDDIRKLRRAPRYIHLLSGTVHVINNTGLLLQV